MRRCDRDVEVARLGCRESHWGAKFGCADVLMVAAQAGVGVLLSDSVVRFALLDATSNERGAA